MSLNTFSQLENKELQSLISWLGKTPKSKKQINEINQSDCEVIKLKENLYIYSSVDSVAEEITNKLYKEPETIGWVAAQASISDLAACGCIPLGILFSTIWEFGTPLSFQQNLANAFKSALSLQNCFLLGGDNGSSSSTVITSVGLGYSTKLSKMRTGIQDNDFLCITGKSGRGPALCIDFLMNQNRNSQRYFSENLYRPMARIAEGILLQKYANAIIDTSDGILSAVKQLCEINNIGIKLIWNENCLDELAIDFCNKLNLPKFLLWIAEHGDFELISAISPKKILQAKKNIPNLEIIGQFKKNKNEHELLFINKNEEINFKIDLNKTQFLAEEKNSSINQIKLRMDSLISYLKNNQFP
ncbi:AIR synthase related protein [Pigmentibacter sp. JX0631]|uniref:AIR synthase related protein n=1 Tax=Pigmentibacter sp. JX0631 TaxID=2976982 RepID=UPI0024691226|nr:AIR synthase related protein [Pigmentibacter sp. JX0631]WGL60605.1 AIR synthase related protein [Pigmentibacter sp. JX0631]